MNPVIYLRPAETPNTAELCIFTAGLTDFRSYQLDEQQLKALARQSTALALAGGQVLP